MLGCPCITKGMYIQGNLCITKGLTYAWISLHHIGYVYSMETLSYKNLVFSLMPLHQVGCVHTHLGYICVTRGWFN